MCDLDCALASRPAVTVEGAIVPLSKFAIILESTVEDLAVLFQFQKVVESWLALFGNLGEHHLRRPAHTVAVYIMIARDNLDIRDLATCSSSQAVQPSTRDRILCLRSGI